MDHKQVRWTADETRRLKELVEVHGRDWPVIGKLLSRSGMSCLHRWRLVCEFRERRNEREREYRKETQKQFYGVRPKGEPVHPVEVPDDVIIERNNRTSAPRSLTSLICGDPAPGFSALDRKLAEARP